MNDKDRIKRVTAVCEHSARGIIKRIDENRQLLNTLKKEAPELFTPERCPWIEGWIAGQDAFLNDLAHAMNIEPDPSIKDYLNKWSGEKKVESYI